MLLRKEALQCLNPATLPGCHELKHCCPVSCHVDRAAAGATDLSAHICVVWTEPEMGVAVGQLVSPASGSAIPESPGAQFHI